MATSSEGRSSRRNWLCAWIAQAIPSFLQRVYRHRGVQFLVAGLAVGLLILLVAKNSVLGASFGPIVAAFVVGVFLKTPGSRKRQLWPPARVWQWVEHGVESVAPRSLKLRLVSPFIAEAVSGAAHGVIAAAFTFLFDRGTYWWEVFGGFTLLWTFGLGGFRSRRRAMKAYSGQNKSKVNID